MVNWEKKQYGKQLSEPDLLMKMPNSFDGNNKIKKNLSCLSDF
jgi:hypothetical protein